jgi:hypothetical protein
MLIIVTSVGVGSQTVYLTALNGVEGHSTDSGKPREFSPLRLLANQDRTALRAPTRIKSSGCAIQSQYLFVVAAKLPEPLANNTIASTHKLC